MVSPSRYGWVMVGDMGETPPPPPTMTATIARILGIPADRARLVEGYLRLEHRTLNSLSAAQIRTAYSEISATIDEDPAMADRVAVSFSI